MSVFQDFLQQIIRMRWTDYVDIAVVAYIIYRLIPLFSRASTKRIAMTIIGIIVIAGMTDAFNLYTLNFFVSGFLQIGLLALVIIFQPELRRLFDHLGSVRLRRFFAPVQGSGLSDNMISQVVSACEVMSSEKVGALIVFTRENRLDEYVRTGTTVDGKVSEQLIRNIFFPKAALHDGAMFIRDGRITAAGCVLPLSESSRLSADLGTRHRAGVGMSEISDAVVVIVSEETGTISVAIGGTLKRHLAPQTLEKLLRKELALDEEPAAKLPLGLEKIMKKEGKFREK